MRKHTLTNYFGYNIIWNKGRNGDE